MGRPREIALTVTGILPKVPASPWRRVTRRKMVVRDPQPAIGEHAPLCRRNLSIVQNLANAVFATVDAGIIAGAFANAFDESNGLIDPHRAAGIVAVLFKIENQEDAVLARIRQGRLNDAQEMIG